MTEDGVQVGLGIAFVVSLIVSLLASYVATGNPLDGFALLFDTVGMWWTS